uniref:Ovule protein n=1 Tax=Brugia timori TaxID=42155 RepID=A0A0R3QCZ7_9BILA
LTKSSSASIYKRFIIFERLKPVSDVISFFIFKYSIFRALIAKALVTAVRKLGFVASRNKSGCSRHM